jgi:hypothetical protein
MADMGLSADDQQRVRNGELVTVQLGAVSERDLSFAIAFLLKASPDVLGKQEVAGQHITADPEVQQYGRFHAAGSLADLASLQITSDEAGTRSNARAGEALNLSAGEIAALQALRGGAPAAIQQQLHRMLLARYQAYRASGLAGIAPTIAAPAQPMWPRTCAGRARLPREACRSTCPPSTRSCWGIPRRRSPGCRSTSSG